MKYHNIVQATFLERPNRFIAHCKIDDEVVIAHVKNTGRCKELLITGSTVYLQHNPSPKRKTDYSLITVKKTDSLINIDSQAPNVVALEGIKGRLITLPGLIGETILLKREVTYGQSRFDLYLQTASGQEAFIEVKGVTLEDKGVVKFPDAPTKRGTKHIYELIEAKKAGYEVYILFVIQMATVTCFTPNQETDPEFSKALKMAQEAGVNIVAYECLVTPESMEISKPVTVKI